MMRMMIEVGGRLPTMKEILKKWHRDLNEIYEEEESERRSFEGIYMGGPKDEDDDNDDEAFVTPQMI